MIKPGHRRSRRLSLLSACADIVLAAALFAGLSTRCLADDGPKPDPSGTATGDKNAAVDAAGNPFVVAEPTDKTAPDYAANKKAFDDYQAQSAKEPLAVKLADDVGHVRVATNFAWTLNTGYLVLFMQAGFALLTCGLVRKKNAGHLMMLNFAAYVFAFLAYYAVGYAFQFGAVAINAAPTNLGGVPDSQPLPDRKRPMGIRGRARDFSLSVRPMTRAATASPCSKSCLWKPPATSSSAPSASGSPSGHFCFANSSLARSFTRSPAAGPGAEDGCRKSVPR